MANCCKCWRKVSELKYRVLNVDGEFRDFCPDCFKKEKEARRTCQKK